MARKKSYRASSPLKYEYKMYRLFGGNAPEGLIAQLVATLRSEYEKNYGFYRQAWESLKKQTWVQQLPKGEYGKLKAALNYLLKALRDKKLAPEDTLIELTKVIGLSDDVAQRLIDFVQHYC
ncbi:hypothetical protein [Thermofilum pendens]|uniref:Uncharacterized protein n=1 Tax=Thermofilum pendens (strain DSM 2475 / Hrk 5) TaxID=368408 RepID=A1S0X6_THEPD|nr:hypothetical protein [Thermofilum pendens]ABL79106.1 hypothetical protein Tpen_1711 [Thermofilum pendens Hrk 5]